MHRAIVKDHATAGFGWRMPGGHNVAASMSYAPKVEQTNPNTGITSIHSQYTWLFNYNTAIETAAYFFNIVSKTETGTGWLNRKPWNSGQSL